MPDAPLTFGIFVDVLAATVLLFFLVRGLIRGVSDELARVLSFIGGIAMRYAFTSMFEVLIFQPADAVLGLAAGAVYTAVILAIVFALAMLIPLTPVQRLFTEQSRVGQQVCPWLRSHMGIQ